MKKNIMIITEIDQKFYIDTVFYNKNEEVKKENQPHSEKFHIEIGSEEDIANINKINNYPYLVGLNLESIFKETFIIPYLPIKESKNAIRQEMIKIYGDYDSKYVYQGSLKPLNKESVNASVIMYDINKFHFILKILKAFKIKQLRLPLVQYSIKGNLLKYISSKDTIFFVNIGEYYTNILIVDKKNIKYQKVIKAGISDINNKITTAFAVEKEVAINIRHDFKKYEGIINKEELDLIYKQELSDIVNNIKAIYIDVSDDYKIEKIYLNVEDNDQNIVRAFKEVLKFNIENIASISNVNNYLHFAFATNKAKESDISFHIEGDTSEKE